jgi:hypothetical protein
MCPKRTDAGAAGSARSLERSGDGKISRRLDTTRIYRKAYDQAGIETGLSSEAEAQQEADAEFDSDEGGA